MCRCASRVGYFPLGKGIDLYLNGANCYSRGTIEHELLHALGFWHEHTRPDRDHYITILWNNVVRGKEYNFKKRGDPGDWTLQLPYDYGSVMHYRPAAFSRDGSSPTLLATDPAAAASMGQRVRASNLDLAKLNRLYRCPYPFYKGEDLVRG
ncbi:hypothetical protein AAG570_004096 [Ranatra chinensis]|uniref:Metalloendopeptidase n=1 Tax=Ranatra chinensis TaxID=642074 RepID=A0ABD0Y2T7_9HEMI